MLKGVDWEPVYESRFGSEESLLDRFYRPLLGNVVRYDRVAGYLSLRSLAHALEGVDSMLEKNGTVRVIAGGELQQPEKGALFPDADAPLEPRVKSQLAIIAELLDRGDLEIKIGDTTQGDGIFHPKLGIGVDRQGNKVSFEGSVNETMSAWTRNFERFKVHRSWVSGEAKFVQADMATFDALWNGLHESVDVYGLPEAAREDLIDWKDYGGSLEENVEYVQSHDSGVGVGEGELASVVSCAGRTPGGVHVAEDVSTITPWPHQRTISDTAVSVYPNNLLFCDEVGLGKTIEAGLTVSRLLHTGEADSALFLVPAGLVTQWQDELQSLFNIHAYRRESRHDGEYLVGPDGTADVPIDDASGFDGAWGESGLGSVVTDSDEVRVVIESWHTARLDRNRGRVAPGADGNVWDVTVVDEAHSASEGTKLYKLLSQVNRDSRCLYALTATPMELDIGDLHDLLRLCDLPDSWQSKDSFREFFETRETLRSVLDNAGEFESTEAARREVVRQFTTELGMLGNGGRERLSEFAEMLMEQLRLHDGFDGRVDELVRETETESLAQRRCLKQLLGEQSVGASTARSLFFNCGPEQWRALVTSAEWGTPVQTRVFRNTREVLRDCENLGLEVGNIPRREVETKRIPLGDVEPVYESIEGYITETYKQSQTLLSGREKLALGFVMTLYKQRLTSSLYAIQQSLQRRQESVTTDVDGLTERLSDLSEDPGVTEATIEHVVGTDEIDAYRPETGEGVSTLLAEQAELQRLVGKLQRLTNDPKLDQLRDDIWELQTQGRDNIIIFTQYRDTLSYVREALSDSHTNIGTYSGEGGMRYNPESESWDRVGKERITNDFKHGAVSILVCTDSASEGLNLQTADALINYDLPWNPMRVEQRIGRIDRIGQENDVVKVINYAYENSIDGEIYERLEQRLGLFEDVVGDMRPVLTTIEKDIKSAAMSETDQYQNGEVVVDAADDRVETVKEHAETVGLQSDSRRSVTREDIIETAGVNGWGDALHNGLAGIGSTTRRFEPLTTPNVIMRLLTQSDCLDNEGWVFTALRNHELASEFPDVSSMSYVLEPPSDRDIQPTGGGESTQDLFQTTHGVIVTFDTSIAREYPSIRLLLPGDPLFDELTGIISANLESELVYVCGNQDDKMNTEITVCNDRVDLGSWDVVLPAVNGNEVLPLLDDGGHRILTVEEAEEQVEEFFSQTRMSLLQ